MEDGFSFTIDLSKSEDKGDKLKEFLCKGKENRFYYLVGKFFYKALKDTAFYKKCIVKQEYPTVFINASIDSEIYEKEKELYVKFYKTMVGYFDSESSHPIYIYDDEKGIVSFTITDKE